MFPTIKHIDDLLWALTDENGVRGEEWVVGERGGFTVINYAVNFSHTFPDLTSVSSEEEKHKAIVRREARGIKFCSETGKILARTLHKFFNIGERDETQPHNVNWSYDLRILMKLDGSMIHPMLLNDELVYCTKMGLTDVAVPAAEHARNHPVALYDRFCRYMISNNFTPIFEWTSRKQKIVVDYPVDQLILIAIRNMHTGEYLPLETLENFGHLYRIPVVQSYGTSISDINEFVQITRLETEGEGYVIRFFDGRMYKIKNEHYCRLHTTKEMLGLEKNVWDLALSESLDDAMAFMDDADRKRVEAFSDTLRHKISEKAHELDFFVAATKNDIYEELSSTEVVDIDKEAKKRFAMREIGRVDPRLKGLCFQIWDGKESVPLLTDFVRNHTGALPKLEGIRDLFGITWSDF